MDTHPPAGSTRMRIARRRHDDVVVLRPLGTLDDALAGDLREQVLEAHAPVIIDLDGCAHLEASAIHDLVTSWLLYRPDFCLSCSSPGDRHLVGPLAASADVQVFFSVEEALATLLES